MISSRLNKAFLVNILDLFFILVYFYSLFNLILGIREEVILLVIFIFVMCFTILLGYKRYGHKRHWWVFSFPAGVGIFLSIMLILPIY